MGMLLALSVEMMVLAQQAGAGDGSLPPDLRSRLFGIVLLTVLLGIIGIVIILMLGVSWRRYNARMTRKERQAREATDPWTTSGQRTYSGDRGDDDSDDADTDSTPDDSTSPGAGRGDEDEDEDDDKTPPPVAT